MPYILDNEGRRKELEKELNPKDPAELNYLFSKIISNYMKYHGESYQVHNDAIGALECAKLELYRRKTKSYEDMAMITNGDVYQF